MIACTYTESLFRGGPFFLVFLVDWGGGERGSKCHYKWAIIGLPAKGHLNGVSLAGRWWPNTECWLVNFVVLQRIWTNMPRNAIFFDFSGGGGGVPDPLSTPPLDPRMDWHFWRIKKEKKWIKKSTHECPISCVAVWAPPKSWSSAMPTDHELDTLEVWHMVPRKADPAIEVNPFLHDRHAKLHPLWIVIWINFSRLIIKRGSYLSGPLQIYQTLWSVPLFTI